MTELDYKKLLLISNEVIESAQALRNSGYDGPFIGEVTVNLFSALAKLEKTEYFSSIKNIK